MKTVCKEGLCCGCMACVVSCRQNAINILDNIYSFNAIKNDNCINCGLCDKVCPQNNPVNFISPFSYKQGWANDVLVRKTGSSGGLASAIGIAFVQNGGYVCSCFFQNGKFGFKITKLLEELRGFAGSKYVKSNPDNIFIDIKKHLTCGEKLLFIGLPCQIAGLKKYLGDKLCDKLYTIDLICHGTPSVKVLSSFLRKKKVDIENISEISFRYKIDRFSHDIFKRFSPKGIVDGYSLAFQHGYSYTNNCYSCQYARKERVSDLTLGDAWGTSLMRTHVDKGISLISCQTQKGKEILENANINLCDIEVETAIAHNGQLNAPTPRPRHWTAFWKYFILCRDLDKTVMRFLFKAKVRQYIKYLFIKLRFIKLSGIIYQIRYK